MACNLLRTVAASLSQILSGVSVALSGVKEAYNAFLNENPPSEREMSVNF